MEEGKKQKSRILALRKDGKEASADDLIAMKTAIQSSEKPIGCCQATGILDIDHKDYVFMIEPEKPSIIVMLF